MLTYFYIVLTNIGFFNSVVFRINKAKPNSGEVFRKIKFINFKDLKKSK